MPAEEGGWSVEDRTEEWGSPRKVEGTGGGRCEKEGTKALQGRGHMSRRREGPPRPHALPLLWALPVVEELSHILALRDS